MITRITAEWLKKEQACEKGLAWFKRQYPYGMSLRKKAFNGFITKALRRKVNTNMWKSVETQTIGDLRWLLSSLGWREKDRWVRRIDRVLYNSTSDSLTQKRILEAFWTDFKRLK